MNFPRAKKARNAHITATNTRNRDEYREVLYRRFFYTRLLPDFSSKIVTHKWLLKLKNQQIKLPSREKVMEFMSKDHKNGPPKLRFSLNLKQIHKELVNFFFLKQFFQDRLLVANHFTKIQPDSAQHIANTEWYLTLLRYFDPQNMLGYFTAATNPENTCVRIEPAATKRKRTQLEILRRNLFSERTLRGKEFSRLSWEIRNWNLQIDKKDEHIVALLAQIAKLEEDKSDMKVKKTNNALMQMNHMDGPLNIRPSIVEYSNQFLTADRKRILNNCALW